MKTLVLTALLGLFALTASAADVTGKWMGQVQGRRGPQDVTFDLQQSGDAVTGTYTAGQGMPAKISDGKVDGDKISFSVTREFNGNSFTQKFTGTVSGSEIKFTQDNGRGNPVEFTAKKQ